MAAAKVSRLIPRTPLPPRPSHASSSPVSPPRRIPRREHPRRRGTTPGNSFGSALGRAGACGERTSSSRRTVGGPRAVPRTASAVAGARRPASRPVESRNRRSSSLRAGTCPHAALRSRSAAMTRPVRSLRRRRARGALRFAARPSAAELRPVRTQCLGYSQRRGRSPDRSPTRTAERPSTPFSLEHRRNSTRARGSSVADPSCRPISSQTCPRAETRLEEDRREAG